MDFFKEFRYSGCGGNKNNFMTHRECTDTCEGAEEKLAKSNVTVCEQPKEVILLIPFNYKHHIFFNLKHLDLPCIV